jgi:hypothetical protein
MIKATISIFRGVLISMDTGIPNPKRYIQEGGKSVIAS